MAIRKSNLNPKDQSPVKLAVPPNDAEAKLRERINKGRELKSLPISSVNQLESTRKLYYTWFEYNVELLKRLFSNDSLATEFSHFIGIGFSSNATLTREVEELHEDIDGKIRCLESILGRIELIPVARSVTISKMSVQSPNAIATRAFLVHGHDEAAKESVARFLEKLGIQAVILHEQASGGLTIIEKLEKNSRVDFAVVLLTPDDVGANAATANQLNARSRQNVILELGFFLGKLGRDRVCALYKGPLELPSDILGITYIPMDDQSWKFKLSKELREVGFKVDLELGILMG